MDVMDGIDGIDGMDGMDNCMKIAGRGTQECGEI